MLILSSRIAHKIAISDWYLRDRHSVEQPAGKTADRRTRVPHPGREDVTEGTNAMRRSKTETTTTPHPGATEAAATDATSTDAATVGPALAVGVAVAAFAGSDRESAGRIVDDFGDFIPVATEYDGERIAEPARRWAVLTTAGDLLFVDSADLTAEPAAK